MAGSGKTTGINISKTKEMFVDFRKKRPKPDPVTIQALRGNSSYRYLQIWDKANYIYLKKVEII